MLKLCQVIRHVICLKMLIKRSAGSGSLDVQRVQGLVLCEGLCQSCDSVVVNHIPTQLQMSQRRVHLCNNQDNLQSGVGSQMWLIGDPGMKAQVNVASNTRHPISNSGTY